MTRRRIRLEARNFAVALREYIDATDIIPTSTVFFAEHFDGWDKAAAIKVANEAVRLGLIEVQTYADVPKLVHLKDRP